jgi:hypothetical protein
MKRVAFFLGFGFLPLWIVLAAVLLISAGPSDLSKYGIAIPWLILGSLPVCGATLLIATGTLAREALASGDQVQKLRSATRFFLSLILISGLIVGAMWLRHQNHEKDLKNQESRAIEFLTSHALVIQHGGKVGAHASSMRMDSDRNVLGYDISTSLGSAIVTVVRQSGGREFKLECITTLSLGGRDPFTSPCEQGTALNETKHKAMSANPSINADAAR